MKEYKKPEMIAKNAPSGSYAAGCPVGNQFGSEMYCRKCERTK